MTEPNPAPPFGPLSLSCLVRFRNRLVRYTKRHWWALSSSNNPHQETKHTASPSPCSSTYNLSDATLEETEPFSSPTVTIASTTSLTGFAERLEDFYTMAHFFIHPDCESCTHEKMPVRPREQALLVHSLEDEDFAVFSAYSGECTSVSSRL